MRLTSREIWIDYAKFISIFLVVLFHTNPNLDGYIFDFLRLLRMPAFFLIAGLLFNMKKWNNFIDFIKHRFKRLIIPYIWFSLIFYILWILIGRNMVGETELAINPLTPIKEFIMGRPNIVLAPYWFITCLFMVQILFYFLKTYINSSIVIIIISILCYWGIIYFDITNLPWCIDKAFLFLPFYAYANILRENTHKFLLRERIYIIILTTISFVLLILNNKFVISPYINHLLYIISGFCIMPVYIVFCKYIASKFNITPISNGIKYIGDNNIITLAVQNYIIGFIKILGVKLLAINLLTTNYYILNIVIALTTIVISMSIAFFINQYVPFLIGKTHNGRIY